MLLPVLEKKESLAKLASEVHIFPQVLRNVKVKDKNETQSNAEVIQAISEVEASLGDNGRILLRASGTEPLIRVMVEAGSIEECNSYIDKVIEVMKNNDLML